MTIAIRKQLGAVASASHVRTVPLLQKSLPWLVMAAAMRVVAYGGGAMAIPAIIVASIAVLHAFLVVAQRSIELAGGQTNLGELGFTEQSRLSLAVLWRITLSMIAVSLAVWAAGYGRGSRRHVERARRHGIRPIHQPRQVLERNRRGPRCC